MLHEMVMKKFNLEAIYPLNLSAKGSSIDDNFDITDDHETSEVEVSITLKSAARAACGESHERRGLTFREQRAENSLNTSEPSYGLTFIYPLIEESLWKSDVVPIHCNNILATGIQQR
uniref:Uncharacterized protein n=1 Tax=Tanacetum cinerariifolium TaxID=118510 RepID=A0A699HPF1_TANCI|nr:hypothetical protein [Tanacetum cinerariifolium]